MQRARRRVVWALLIGPAVASGWVAAGGLALQTSSSGSRTVVDDEVSQLLQAMRRRDLDAEEQQRLLERLLTPGTARRREAGVAAMAESTTPFTASGAVNGGPSPPFRRP